MRYHARGDRVASIVLLVLVVLGIATLVAIGVANIYVLNSCIAAGRTAETPVLTTYCR